MAGKADEHQESSPGKNESVEQSSSQQTTVLSSRIQEALQNLDREWEQALIKSSVGFYKCTTELLQHYITIIEYGLHKGTGRIRRKKSKVPNVIPQEEVLNGLQEWSQQLGRMAPVQVVINAMAGRLRELPAVLYEVQSPERFELQADDLGWRSFLKRSKIAAHSAQNQTYALLSRVAPRLRPAPWKQRVPLRILVETNQVALLQRMLSEQKHQIELSRSIEETCEAYFNSFLSSLADQIKTEKPEADDTSGLEAFYEALQELMARIKRQEKAEADHIQQHVQAQLQQLYRDCARVDTIELPRRRFSDAAVKHSQKQVLQEYQNYRDLLTRDAALFLDELRLKYALFRFGKTGYEQMQGVNHRLFRLFKDENGFRGVIQSAQQSYDENARNYAIPAEARRSDARLITRITDLREVLQRLLMPLPEREVPPDEQADIDPETLRQLPAHASQMQAIQAEETLIDEFTSAVLYQGNELRERLSYHESRKVESGLPATDAAHIELREEVTAYLRGVLLRKLAPLPGRIQQECSKLQESWLEMAEMVSINLGSAIDVVEDREEEKYRIKASELADETLRRGRERLLELTDAAGKAHERIQEDFNAAASESMLFLLEMALEDTYSQLKWKSRSLKVEETALGWKSKVIMYWSRFRDTAAVLQRFSGQKYRSGSTWFQESIGMGNTGDEASIQTDAAQFLAETDYIIAQLPLIYRRLYRNEPVEHKRFLIGRSSQLASLRKAYTDWQAKYYSNFIAIGERGSGKTSILEIGIQHLDLPEDKPVIRGGIHHTIYTEAELLTHLCTLFGYDKTSSRAEFITLLRQRKDRPVVVWEGFQNLYLRHLAGFEALEAFLLIISQTGKQVFWAISCSRYAWSYLEKIFRVGEYFIQKCFTDELSAAEIREVIMSRHPISGYELEFIAGEREQSTRSFKKLLNDAQARQEYLAKRYFTELYQVSEGNISIALLYWLRSVQIEDDITIKIAPLANSLKQIGDGLSEDAIFVLAFILLHDDLTPLQLALALHISEEESQLLLSRLSAKSLLSANEEGRYYLNHLLYRHITRILKTKNILH